MKPDLNKYVALQTAIVNEKAALEARLAAINKVLAGTVSLAAASPAAPSPTTTTIPGKRTMSEATKAKMRASQQARWAKKKGTAEATKPSTTATAIPSAPAPKKKRKMSAAGKANIRAAVKARWAKVEAAKAKTGK